ncbi:hypothetical protein HU200_063689 [Digitaria exilis]|uniref:F-box domain-containing protein n=1 Tax=Digitaria exilis TaxID=1010633 RepID=A0A835A2S7_9POAL|nr:hypothetical protein HU200_063689 [Digitaria exilis]
MRRFVSFIISLLGDASSSTPQHTPQYAAAHRCPRRPPVRLPLFLSCFCRWTKHRNNRPPSRGETHRGARNMFDGMTKKAAASGGQDRISELPDALLHHVLSLLPVDEAVQTSVLARRWLHLWKGMPVLRLVGPKKRFPTAEGFDRFVNRLISAPYLTGDDYGGEPDEPEPNPYFDSWIQYALSCRVRELKVVGDLVGGETELVVPLVSQHLTSLDVHHVFLGEDIVDFSSCPLLEELTLRESGFWVRSMSFPSLKRLFLIECNFPEDYRIPISAPSVVSLRLDVSRGKTPLFESMPLLETACIDLTYAVHLKAEAVASDRDDNSTRTISFFLKGKSDWKKSKEGSDMRRFNCYDVYYALPFIGAVFVGEARLSEGALFSSGKLQRPTPANLTANPSPNSLFLLSQSPVDCIVRSQPQAPSPPHRPPTYPNLYSRQHGSRALMRRPVVPSPLCHTTHTRPRAPSLTLPKLLPSLPISRLLPAAKVAPPPPRRTARATVVLATSPPTPIVSSVDGAPAHNFRSAAKPRQATSTFESPPSSPSSHGGAGSAPRSAIGPYPLLYHRRLYFYATTHADMPPHVAASPAAGSRGARKLFDGMKKNKAAAASGGDDLTRELPDALLHHVLSFLPVDEAVQTSVLARRWLHLWKDMPVLRLASPKKRFPTAEDFDRFANCLISARGDSPLVRCEIEAYLAGDDYAGEPDELEPNQLHDLFDSSIQYVLACKVRVLRVVGHLVGSETELVVPLCLTVCNRKPLHFVQVRLCAYIPSPDPAQCGSLRHWGKTAAAARHHPQSPPLSQTPHPHPPQGKAAAAAAADDWRAS